MFGQIIIGFVLLQIVAHTDPVSVPNGFLTGEDFIKEFDSREQSAYAIGFVNGILVSPLITPAAQTVASNVQQCLIGRTNSQITEIIRGYIEAMPERRDLPLNILSYEALMKSCRAN
jgi:hypothetical protein